MNIFHTKHVTHNKLKNIWKRPNRPTTNTAKREPKK